jgi:hypothetical protein
MQYIKKVNIIRAINGYKKNMQRENPLALLKRVLWIVLKQIQILYHKISF